jgi:hypothetical protein
MKIVQNRFKKSRFYELPGAKGRVGIAIVTQEEPKRVKKEFFDHLNKELKHKSEHFVDLVIYQQSEDLPQGARRLL